MNPVAVRNIKIGEGLPKVCVPVTGDCSYAAGQKRRPDAYCCYGDVRLIRGQPIDIVYNCTLL